ncbi:MAG: low-specificity L-threonine aldolase [Bacillota bacterium]|nr:low-specificity L-threonine aldolase [Bacillota bacterium]
MKVIDLRSDTVTLPTDLMRQAMFEAKVGDDVYGDDPTMRELEQYAANLVGKQAALFVPSGTFGNQLSLFTHCQRGDEVILGDDCHIVQHEVGASAVIAGVQLRTLRSNCGVLDPKDIRAHIREEDLHFPSTGLVCLENAHSNGRVIPLENMKTIYSLAREHYLPVHLDGARLFNAAAYLNVDAKKITQYCDSVMFCLSKGLCAPVGSILAGDQDFVDNARKGRKLMGGGLRQAGFLAAAGLIALKDMRLRLDDDHQNALQLGKALASIPGVEICLEDIQINMIFFKLPLETDASYVVEELRNNNILVNPPEGDFMRFVTHHGIGSGEINQVISVMKKALSKEK